MTCVCIAKASWLVLKVAQAAGMSDSSNQSLLTCFSKLIEVKEDLKWALYSAVDIAIYISLSKQQVCALDNSHLHCVKTGPLNKNLLVLKF